MRMLPVTGDLPALATAPPLPARHVSDPPAVPATAPVEHSAATGTGADAADDRRQPPPHPPFFDPPLIAQRAALGLPTGFLIADLARSAGISYAAASAAVDDAMPRTAEPAG